jgi:hypothetical protein
MIVLLFGNTSCLYLQDLRGVSVHAEICLLVKQTSEQKFAGVIAMIMGVGSKPVYACVLIHPTHFNPEDGGRIYFEIVATLPTIRQCKDP